MNVIYYVASESYSSYVSAFTYDLAAPTITALYSKRVGISIAPNIGYYSHFLTDSESVYLVGRYMT